MIKKKILVIYTICVIAQLCMGIGFLLDKQIAPGILLILMPIITSIGLYASVRNYKNKQK
ncbi:MAG: hypothetical protein E7242_00530 [Lachnospiraceae bacterium]|nr:hypothetical protein [Lachnospiraceae bacterium]